MSGSDPDLVERFATNLGPCLPRLLAGARLLMRDPNLADDVLQTGLLEAFRTYDPVLHDDHFQARTWRCVVNAARDQSRRKRRLDFMEASSSFGELDLIADLRAAEDHERLLSDPELFLEGAGDTLKAAVLALPDSERWVFLLRAMGDLKYREIAEILEVPLGSVMTWLHRARQRLRQALVSIPPEEMRR
jgi:RNA polymerase sigma-70 factor (ECF subfamily)